MTSEELTIVKRVYREIGVPLGMAPMVEAVVRLTIKAARNAALEIVEAPDDRDRRQVADELQKLSATVEGIGNGHLLRMAAAMLATPPQIQTKARPEPTDDPQWNSLGEEWNEL